MIPKIIHQFWLGSEPPESVVYHHETVARTNPDWRVKLWNEKEVNEYICKRETYNNIPNQLAACVDVIKLHCLKKYGGVVMDTDFIGVRPLDPVLKYSAFACRQPDGVTCNAVYGAKKAHPWIDAMLSDKRHTWCCPHCCYIMEPAMTGLDVEIVPTDWFFPYGHNEHPVPPSPFTLAIHLWEGSWT